MKALHRLIVTSATYRQASSATPALVARDPENRLLARGPRFRLPAEVVRDNALAIAGSAGHAGSAARRSSRISRPGLWEELAGGAGEAPYVQDKGPKLYRRSLYVYRKRTVPHPALATFDAPSREVCQVKRPRTNTPLQALELLNDVTYVEAARQLAQLALEQGGSSPEERITFAFRRALARAADRRGAGRLAARARAVPQGLRAPTSKPRLQLIRHGESPPDPQARPGRAGGLHGDGQRHPQPGRDDHARVSRDLSDNVMQRGQP